MFLNHMNLQPLHSLLLLGFTLGLLHAMDADHIMAVSVLISNKKDQRKSGNLARILRFCFAWAIGHGCTFLFLSAIFIFLGVKLPNVVSHWAEKLIGLILVSAGTGILWNIFTKKINFYIHSHNDITHVHLLNKDEKYHNHKPVLVGITHGVAGSAPILALMPTIESNSAWSSFVYSVLFSLGVLFTMIVFGFCFGHLQNFLARFGESIYQINKAIIAAISVGCGSYWLLVA